MAGFVQELVKRGVVRAAGLYVALVWLFLQIADVIFPAFNIPDSAVRYILYGAGAFFPFAMLFAWFYELTTKGLVHESVAVQGDFKHHFFHRYTPLFTVIVLAIALAISVLFNVKQAADTPMEDPGMVSLLIADAVNLTGDPVFEGALEQALAIGLESAPFISSYPRHGAQKIAAKLSGGKPDLAEKTARLVALREGISLVVLPAIEKSGSKFELSLRAINAESGEEVFDETTAQAKDKAQVLKAVTALVDDIRVGLGDVIVDEDPAARETFTAASIEAVSFYIRAQKLSRQGKYEEALPLYEKATQEDPRFGRAYSGLALTAFNLGHTHRAAELWDKTLSLMEDMSDRERYRTLGLYYSIVVQNYPSAIENYELLVKHFPADRVGLNNLAVVYFYDRQFDEAMRVGNQVTLLYPRDALVRANLALYAMYASNWGRAKEEAKRTLELDESYYTAYLPLAIAHLAGGDQAAAIESYDRMADLGQRANSLAQQGLADVALLEGRFGDVINMLQSAIRTDMEQNNLRGAERKSLLLAHAQLYLGNFEGAVETLATVADSSRLAQQVTIALIYIGAGRLKEAKAIVTTLRENLNNEYRAAADYLEGSIRLNESDFGGAVDALTSSIDRLDTWLARFERGRVFATAGFNAEALAEFELCRHRVGEASAVFLDDIPTFSITATLDYWLGRVMQELGMRGEAQQALERFLTLRGDSDGQLVADARQRLQAVSASLYLQGSAGHG